MLGKDDKIQYYSQSTFKVIQENTFSTSLKRAWISQRKHLQTYTSINGIFFFLHLASDIRILWFHFVGTIMKHLV